jgi:hypothetical protein
MAGESLVYKKSKRAGAAGFIRTQSLLKSYKYLVTHRRLDLIRRGTADPKELVCLTIMAVFDKERR